MNLLRDPLFPGILESGKVVKCTLASLLAGNARPYIPDAFLEENFVVFLSAVIQCVLAPQDVDDWLRLYGSTPDEAEIQSLLDRIADAFDITEFMQIARPVAGDNPEESPLGDLELSGPGQQGRKDNAVLLEDKGSETYCLLPSVMALKIFAYMSNVSAPGRGDSATVRGSGGPATFMVKRRGSLWKTVMLNVLTLDEIGWTSLPGAEDMPWVAIRAFQERDDRLLESGIKPARQALTVSDFHQCAALFPSSVAIRMVLRPGDGRECHLTGLKEAVMATAFIKQSNSGMKYDKGWPHPYSPVSISGKNLRYKNIGEFSTRGEVFPWSGMGTWWRAFRVSPKPTSAKKGEKDDKAVVTTVRPPDNLRAFEERSQELTREEKGLIYVTLSGPEIVNNSKMASVTVANSPLLNIDSRLERFVSRELERYTAGTELAYLKTCESLGACLKRLMAKNAMDASRAALGVHIHEMNHEMLGYIHKSISIMNTHDRNDLDAELEKLRLKFHQYLDRHCTQMFDRHSDAVLFSPAGDVVKGNRKQLRRFLTHEKGLPYLLAVSLPKGLTS